MVHLRVRRPPRLRGVRPGPDPCPAGGHAGTGVRRPRAGFQRGGRCRRVRAEEAARYRARSGPVLLAYLERSVRSDAEPVGGGARLRGRRPGADDEVPVRFVGYIDRIDRRPGGAIEVIDHKTGKPRSQDECGPGPPAHGLRLRLRPGRPPRPGDRRGAAGRGTPRAPLRRDRAHGLDHPVGRGARRLRCRPGRRGRGHPPPRVRAARGEGVPVVRVPRYLPGCRTIGDTSERHPHARAHRPASLRHRRVAGRSPASRPKREQAGRARYRVSARCRPPGHDRVHALGGDGAAGAPRSGAARPRLADARRSSTTDP